MDIGESSPSSLCELELLAWFVYCQYAKYYSLPIESMKKSGAEWWVQVKPVSLPEDTSTSLSNANRLDNTATTAL